MRLTKQFIESVVRLRLLNGTLTKVTVQVSPTDDEAGIDGKILGLKILIDRAQELTLKQPDSEEFTGASNQSS